jgi:hypothetical protein
VALHHYRVFGELLACEFLLPDLVEVQPAGDETTALQVSLAEPCAVDQASYKALMEWPAVDGRPYCRLARHGEDFLLEFPGYIAFELQADGHILCHPQARCDDHLARHFLLNQAIPRLLGHRGRLLLHAGAAVLPGGEAIAFCGPSGSGKSTLATACHQAGFRLLSDDCIRLVARDGRTEVHGGAAGVRLHDPNEAPVLTGGVTFSAADRYSGKRTAALPTPGALDEAPLSALFLLGPSVDDLEVTVTPVPAAEAMMACLGAIFCLDARSPDTTTQAFAALGMVLRTGVPVYRLCYPRQYGKLAEVLGAMQRTALESRHGR